MAYATGLRLLSAGCFIIGGLSLIAWPILWPIGYFFHQKAVEKEREREKEFGEYQETQSESQTEYRQGRRH